MLSSPTLLNRRSHVALLAAALAPVFSAVPHAQEVDADATENKWGHSSHGGAYDVGPRQKPWIMEGIGSTPFPISSTNDEVQMWFDQAIAQLHGFWYYEAERSLRWCLKLDPECAMAYWGMALATREDDERSGEFLAEAVARKDSVTPRERAFIEMYEKFRAVNEAEDRDEANEDAMIAFDQLLMDYPDDVEAKSLYWLIGGRALGRAAGLARYGLEAVLDDVLDASPDHVGAHHYRVHNWDGKEGRYAVESCMRLGEIAPNCGHLLHMPGHVLSGIGLWHEAAIAMDRATRVEKAYMHERMILPENNWDYVHNLDYLCYIQEQLGMADSALLGAEQLLLAPAAPEEGRRAGVEKMPLIRALMKFERWDDILAGDRVTWDMDMPMEAHVASYSKCRALIGAGRYDEAEDVLVEMKKTAKVDPGDTDGPGGWIAARVARQAEVAVKELEARLHLSRNENLEGIALLSEAAVLQEERWMNDPPHEPYFLFNVLGDAYLELGAPKLAIDCYERTLETVFHDGFALAGLVVANAQIGADDAAREAMAKLRVVWSDADRPNRWLAAAEATGIEAEPFLEAPVEQRNYKSEVLDVEGPSLWIPTYAPELTALGADGEEVALDDYLGRNVLLVFYLGDECVHCIEQISAIEERFEELTGEDTVVLASSKDAVDEIAVQSESLQVTLLSDPAFENARRFQSFDDFEEIELHSTFLIDRQGRVHWSRIGGEPFMDIDFLVAELSAMNGRGELMASSEGTTEAAVEVEGTR